MVSRYKRHCMTWRAISARPYSKKLPARAPRAGAPPAASAAASGRAAPPPAANAAAGNKRKAALIKSESASESEVERCRLTVSNPR